MEKVQFIWDFRGDDALETARHHQIHLKEFLEREKVGASSVEVEEISNVHAIAYIIASRGYLQLIRDSLKPHRAALIEI